MRDIGSLWARVSRPMADNAWRHDGAHRNLVLLLIALMGSELLAATGSSFTLPANATKAKNGLLLTIDTRWVDASGYRPVRIHVTNWPPAPSVADRTLQVELRPNDHGRPFGSADISLTTEIELPEGNVAVTKTVAIPQSRAWHHLEINTREDGRWLRDLSTTDSAAMLSGSNMFSEAVPTVLIIDAAAPRRNQRDAMLTQPGLSKSNSLPDVSVLYKHLPYYNQHYQNVSILTGSGDLSTLQNLQNIPGLELLPPSELPDRWMDYSAFDLIFLSFADLQSIIDQRPQTWRALRNWVATGPTLCVYAVGTEYQYLEDLESRLALPPIVDEEASKDNLRGWQVPAKRHRRDTIRAFKNVEATWGRRPVAVSPSGEMQVPAKTADPTPSTSSDDPPFVMREMSLGHVVAFSADQVFPGDNYQWSWLLNSLKSKNWAWYQRHGMSLYRENEKYWNFLIPGVGLAPVASFLVLISLFVVVIGPVNYMFLRRWRRLHLLLATVPLGAVLVTLCLFAWAVLADGLGVRARLRSYTEIEQQSGQTVSWSRQSYYAGIVPSQGLTFPSDVVVYPLEHFPERPEWRSQERVLVWNGEQNLRAGYMQSRVTSQFLVGRSRPTELRLDIRSVGDAPATQKNQIEVTNRLNTLLLHLYVVDAQGQGFWSEDVRAGATVLAVSLGNEDAVARLAKLIGEQAPDYPPDYDKNTYQTAIGFRRQYYYMYGRVDQSMPPATTETSKLEIQLDSLGRAKGMKFKPRSYIAIVEASPEVPLGIESAKLEASLHVIRGSW